MSGARSKNGSAGRSDFLGGREGVLELEDHADGDFWAPLIRAEIAGAHRVDSAAQSPARLEGYVDASTEGVGEGMLVTVGRLRSEVGITDQSVSPDFQAAPSGPTKSGSAATEGKPRTLPTLGGMSGGKIAFCADPILEVIDRIYVEAIRILGDAGQFVKTEEGVAEVELKIVSLENAGDILRGWGRNQGQSGRRRSRKRWSGGTVRQGKWREPHGRGGG